MPLKDRFVNTILHFICKLYGLIPYSWIKQIGKFFGIVIYYTVSKYRKRTLSNLSLAKAFSFHEQELKQTAKRSLQSLATAFLEFPKFLHEKNLSQIVLCENPEEAENWIRQGQGVVFFCAHQANWELFFLEGNSRMPGIAIGRPIKHGTLYDFVLKIRGRFGGKIVPPHEAMKEGTLALKEGKFVGFVADQSMPTSSFHSEFLGCKAYSTTAPALLAYKTGSPLIVATMRREGPIYKIRYSQPILPNPAISLKKEVERMTRSSLSLLEESIKQTPHEWLWIHNRFKQEDSSLVFYPYRQDSILIAVDSMKTVDPILIRKLYPKAFIDFLSFDPIDAGKENVYYQSLNHPFPRFYLYKLLINLSSYSSIESHFQKLSILCSLNKRSLNRLIKKRGLSTQAQTFSEKMIYALARHPENLMLNMD